MQFATPVKCYDRPLGGDRGDHGPDLPRVRTADFDAVDWYDPTAGVDFIQQLEAILRHIQFNTSDVGNGDITGDSNLFDQFDIGIAIGESDGVSQGDDFQSVTMRVQAGLMLEDLVAVAVRGQSVGEPGSSRTGSSKEFVLLTADLIADGSVDPRDVADLP